MLKEHRRILVVEDETGIQMVLQEALDFEGYDVRSAANGREALAVLENWKPDVILLDLMMPVMSGTSFRTAQREMSNGRATVPIVVLSGAHNAHERAAKMDAEAVVTKPFDLDELLGTVDRVLDGQSPAADEGD